MNLLAINALSELERAGWKYEPAGENEVRIRCPAHDDDTPSAAVNTAKNKWKCHAAGCKGSGDIVTLLALIMSVERATMLADLSTRYELQEVKSIQPSRIETLHAKIWDAGPLLTSLRERGVTDPMIRAARLGFAKGRITIPVYDLQRRIINVRRYLPGAPGPNKMRNTKGYGRPAIYQPEQLAKFDKVVWCGGEMKALAAGWYLKRKGIGAFSVTASEGVWESRWNGLLKGKTVYICMDVDHHGELAATKAARLIARAAAAVYICRIPLDVEKYPKGDLNDWIGHEGARTSELVQMLEDAELFDPADQVTVTGANGDATDVRIQEVTDPRNVARRIAFTGVVSALAETPFLVPSKLTAFCDRDQPLCHACPINQLEPSRSDNSVEVEVPPTALGMLMLVDQPAGRQREGVMAALGVPRCKVAQFVPQEHSRVHDVRLAPTLLITSEGTSNHAQPALIVNHTPELNVPYRFEGVTYPHPANQQAVLLIDKLELAEDSLSSFAPSVSDLETLKILQPRSWTLDSLSDKLDQLWTDLEHNVTRIFGRREPHVLFDLAYHSPLVIQANGRNVPGWVNVLIVGDSGHGKSEMGTQISQHYGLGERVEAKNATVAGILGGLSQIGNRWFVQWGVIPTHDRRLVILEEIKGADPEVIAKLTDMRSSGVAELQKIERRRAHARTRLIMISNPRGAKRLENFNFGVDAIKELIGGLEDIRRFDAACLMSGKQVDVAQMTALASEPSKIPNVLTRDVARRAILWAWTRTPGQVEFEDTTWEMIREKTLELCAKYTEAIPLIDRGTTRFKLARLSAALAARTFSVRDDPQVIVVRPCHVQYIARFLDAQYGDPHFGYADYSRAQVQADELVDPKLIQRQLMGTKYPKDLVSSLLYRDEITTHDFEDWCEVDQESARRLVSFLVRKRAMFRKKRQYRKTAEFIALLKTLAESDLPDTGESHEEDEF